MLNLSSRVLQFDLKLFNVITSVKRGWVTVVRLFSSTHVSWMLLDVIIRPQKYLGIPLWLFSPILGTFLMFCVPGQPSCFTLKLYRTNYQKCLVSYLLHNYCLNNQDIDFYIILQKANIICHLFALFNFVSYSVTK